MPRLSVVIPTHRRPQILRKTLDHLEDQTIADELEVIVVSDGPDTDTAKLFENHNRRINLQYHEIEKSQQGVARNFGVLRASAPVVLFIGDDIFLEPDACERHVEMHATNADSAILGFTTWDPSLAINATMRWLETSGWQFGYPKIQRYAKDVIPAEIQDRFTYTSHISLPLTVAREHPFREDVTLYGWEDIEWGTRLRDASIQLIYEPDARAYHHHLITLDQSLERMCTLGTSAVHMQNISPDTNVVPKGWKWIAYQFAAMLPTMAGRHRKAFLKGIKKALQ